MSATGGSRSDEAAALERFERSLAALVSALEDGAAGAESLTSAGEACAAAFASLQAEPGDAHGDLARVRSLLALAAESVRRESEFVQQRLALASHVRRGLRDAGAPPTLGESCDVAG